MSFHSKMVKLRKINGFTQETFAAAVGVSRQSVYKWESGASYPEVEKLFKISRLFHVTVDDMLNEEMDVSVNGTMMTVAEVQAEADRRAAEAAERKARREANKAKREAAAAAKAAEEAIKAAEEAVEATSEEKIPSASAAEEAPAAENSEDTSAAEEKGNEKKKGGLFGIFRRR